jgi:DNA-directed RNA polymerase subunit K/omega
VYARNMKYRINIDVGRVKQVTIAMMECHDNVTMYTRSAEHTFVRFTYY